MHTKQMEESLKMAKENASSTNLQLQSKEQVEVDIKNGLQKAQMSLEAEKEKLFLKTKELCKLKQQLHVQLAEKDQKIGELEVHVNSLTLQLGSSSMQHQQTGGDLSAVQMELQAATHRSKVSEVKAAKAEEKLLKRERELYSLKESLKDKNLAFHKLESQKLVAEVSLQKIKCKLQTIQGQIVTSTNEKSILLTLLQQAESKLLTMDLQDTQSVNSSSSVATVSKLKGMLRQERSKITKLIQDKQILEQQMNNYSQAVQEGKAMLERKDRIIASCLQKLEENSSILKAYESALAEKTNQISYLETELEKEKKIVMPPIENVDFQLTDSDDMEKLLSEELTSDSALQSDACQPDILSALKSQSCSLDEKPQGRLQTAVVAFSSANLFSQNQVEPVAATLTKEPFSAPSTNPEKNKEQVQSLDMSHALAIPNLQGDFIEPRLKKKRGHSKTPVMNSPLLLTNGDDMELEGLEAADDEANAVRKKRRFVMKTAPSVTIPSPTQKDAQGPN